MLTQARTEYVAPRRPHIPGGSTVSFHRLLVGPAEKGIVMAPRNQANESGTYSFIAHDKDGNRITAASLSCSDGSISTAASWTLSSSHDGAYTFGFQDDRVLRANPGNGGQLDFESLITDTWSSWIIQPIGDGQFRIINRANGMLMSADSNGCAHLESDTASPIQRWEVERPIL